MLCHTIFLHRIDEFIRFYSCFHLRRRRISFLCSFSFHSCIFSIHIFHIDRQTKLGRINFHRLHTEIQCYYSSSDEGFRSILSFFFIYLRVCKGMYLCVYLQSWLREQNAIRTKNGILKISHRSCFLHAGVFIIFFHTRGYVVVASIFVVLQGNIKPMNNDKSAGKRQFIKFRTK